MINLIFSGIGLGLLLSIMLGPIFFVVLETSIKKGARSALFLDLGVFLSDIMYICIAYIFANQVSAFSNHKHAYWLLIIGGAVFVIFGGLKLRKKIPRKTKKGINPNDLKANNYLATIVKGFVLNAVNPGILFYWFGMIAYIKDQEKLDWCSMDTTVILYLSVILVTFFSIDVLKIFGAKKLKNVLTSAWLIVINRVLGIILVCFGFIFLFKGLLAASETM